MEESEKDLVPYLSLADLLRLLGSAGGREEGETKRGTGTGRQHP